MNTRMTLTAIAFASLALAGCGTTAPTMAADPDPLTADTAPGKLVGDPLLQNQGALTEEVRTGN